jgi:glycerol kinase
MVVGGCGRQKIRPPRRENPATYAPPRHERRTGPHPGTAHHKPGGNVITILVVDVGTSSIRASVVRPDGTVGHVQRRPLRSTTPFPGLVEFDPAAMADAALEVSRLVLDEVGPVDGVGITAQRASAVAWDATTGAPIGPGIGWQDLRTAGTCLELQAEGYRLSPSETAPKWAWLLDTHDPGRSPTTRVGTVDSWIAWHLSGGEAHVTDRGNAAVTGLLHYDGSGWRDDLGQRLGIPASMLPRLVDSSGPFATATALRGAPPLAGLAGDQQASLVGQGCVRPGMAKATFGSGAMLDVCIGATRPSHDAGGPEGCFPIIAWQRGGEITWGLEAIMLSAGSSVDWLVEDLGILTDAAESEAVAAGCTDTDGVVMVPALLGFGTPSWDFGARGLLIGLTRGSGRAQLPRAVLEGVANQGADLLAAAEADSGLTLDGLRIDGGMSTNRVFVQALADACGRPVEVSPEAEATTVGAGYLAGLAVGTWSGLDEVAGLWRPRATVDPAGDGQRERWHRAVERARAWYPELSALRF